MEGARPALIVRPWPCPPRVKVVCDISARDADPRGLLKKVCGDGEVTAGLLYACEEACIGLGLVLMWEGCTRA